MLLIVILQECRYGKEAVFIVGSLAVGVVVGGMLFMP